MIENIEDLKDFLNNPDNNDVDINSLEIYGKSLLYVACENGDYKIIEILLKRGADPNIYDHNGQSALDLANNHSNSVIAHVISNFTNSNSNNDDPSEDFQVTSATSNYSDDQSITLVISNNSSAPTAMATSNILEDSQETGRASGYFEGSNI